MKALLLLIVFGVVFWPPELPTLDRSRSCPGSMPVPPCAEFWRHDTVFIGTVKKLVKEPFTEPNHVYWQQYQKVTATLAVDEVFRGDVGAEVVFEMGDCYFDFTENEKYLIYTNKGADGKFTLKRYYGRSGPLSEAVEDLNFIRSLPTAPSGGRVYGEVWDHRGSVTLRVNDDDRHSYRKMAGVTIHLRGGGRSYQTASDAEGRYEFSGVPPGEYDLSTDLPDFLSGSRQKVRVIDKACSEARISIQATGEIRGRLVDENGKPVKGAVISIFSADGVTEDMFDRVRPHYMTRHNTEQDGSFVFVRLRSGRYYLAVNMVEQERQKESLAAEYPRLFFPGVTSFRGATPVVLKDGEKLANVEIKLPPLAIRPHSKP